MDPLSALIGGGASLLGAFMNTSSTQAINAANLQQQTWAAQGGYLPGLVANATKAGINPLAAIGIHTPSMGGMVAPNPGAGVAEAGKYLASIKDPHTLAMEKLQLRSAESDIQLKNAEITNTMVDAARKRFVLNQLSSGKVLPGDTRDRSLSEMGAGWLSELMSAAQKADRNIHNKFKEWGVPGSDY